MKKLSLFIGTLFLLFITSTVSSHQIQSHLDPRHALHSDVGLAYIEISQDFKIEKSKITPHIEYLEGIYVSSIRKVNFRNETISKVLIYNPQC